MSIDLSSGWPTRSVSIRARSLAIKRLGHAFLHQQPRPRAAHLPLVEPDRVHQTFDRGVEIGVVEDNERRFAAQFE